MGESKDKVMILDLVKTIVEEWSQEFTCYINIKKIILYDP